MYQNNSEKGPMHHDNYNDGFNPVLKVLKKEIYTTTRDRTLGERVRFFREKQIRSSFNPKYDQDYTNFS